MADEIHKKIQNMKAQIKKQQLSKQYSIQRQLCEVQLIYKLIESKFSQKYEKCQQIKSQMMEVNNELRQENHRLKILINKLLLQISDLQTNQRKIHNQWDEFQKRILSKNVQISSQFLQQLGNKVSFKSDLTSEQISEIYLKYIDYQKQKLSTLSDKYQTIRQFAYLKGYQEQENEDEDDSSNEEDPSQCWFRSKMDVVKHLQGYLGLDCECNQNILKQLKTISLERLNTLQLKNVGISSFQCICQLNVDLCSLIIQQPKLRNIQSLRKMDNKRLSNLQLYGQFTDLQIIVPFTYAPRLKNFLLKDKRSIFQREKTRIQSLNWAKKFESKKIRKKMVKKLHK